MATDEQVMMTLAALATTGSTQRPSGETVAQQSTRIAAGIAEQLAMTSLATAGAWTVLWVGLTDDRANLAYVAGDTSANAFAVALRGTTDSLVDAAEDLDVGTPVLFPQSGSDAVHISSGALEAFTEVVGAQCQVVDSPLEGQTLLEALISLLDAAPASPTLYVTGHSLGGALATTVSLYLGAQAIREDLTYAVYTFAAPTAGLTDFQEYFDTTFGAAAHRTYGAYDLVPYAWQDLTAVKSWYPSPGPDATTAVDLLVDWAIGLAKGNVYAQPTGNVHELNTDYAVHAPVTSTDTICAFATQVLFQHQNSTYLGLLGAAVPPAPPAVASVSPHFGEKSGGQKVTVNGSGFTADCMVDFGTVAVPADDVCVDSPTQLTAVAPAGSGIIDVRVTNMIGTSGWTTGALYTYV